MAKLNPEQKMFIVQELACFLTPTEVCASVKAKFNIEIERGQVSFYDPTILPRDKKLPEKYKKIFEETRGQYLEHVAHVAIANKRFRMDVLQEVLERQRQREARLRNDALILSTLEQAAKEMGGAFTNKREHSGPDGGPIPLDVGSKRKELAAQMLRKLRDKGKSDAEARASLVAMGVNESDLPAI